MNSPSIALIGARRAHQGLGPFVAKFLAKAGARIPAFLGTSEANNAKAAAELKSIAGLSCAGYTNLDSLLDGHPVDALAILSPPETHAKYLRLAAARGLHVLCEKPFVLDGIQADLGLEQHLAPFDQAQLLVEENCQWPRMLDPYRELFGADSLVAPKRFAMGLSPSSRGVHMGSDSLSHPLSLLQGLDPGPARVSGIRVDSNPSQDKIRVQFHFQGPTQGLECEVFLEDSPMRPRPAWLQFDSGRADRLIRASDYAIFLVDGNQQVPAPDPMELHLRDFVHKLGRTLGGEPPQSTTPILHRARMLNDLLAAFPPSDS
ncbi:MAG: Gfo/Idh/MocA family oxidoreductase [Planctomycetota bacterium]|nr:Gfo/Idh/MocA family oxidoreductase [Planctomycetota bacterium]